jgi:Ca2+:H+ antiporter
VRELFAAIGLAVYLHNFLAVTQLHSSLLSLSVAAVLLPAAYHFALRGNSHIASQMQMQNILSMSHGVSIVLLFSAAVLT